MVLISSKNNEKYMNPKFVSERIPEHSHHNFVYVRQTLCAYYMVPLATSSEKRGSKVIFLTTSEKILP